MLCDGSVKVIDPEFTVFAPPGLDAGSLMSGFVLAHLCISHISPLYLPYISPGLPHHGPVDIALVGGNQQHLGRCGGDIGGY